MKEYIAFVLVICSLFASSLAKEDVTRIYQRHFKKLSKGMDPSVVIPKTKFNWNGGWTSSLTVILEHLPFDFNFTCELDAVYSGTVGIYEIEAISKSGKPDSVSVKILQADFEKSKHTAQTLDLTKFDGPKAKVYYLPSNTGLYGTIRLTDPNQLKNAIIRCKFTTFLDRAKSNFVEFKNPDSIKMPYEPNYMEIDYMKMPTYYHAPENCCIRSTCYTKNLREPYFVELFPMIEDSPFKSYAPATFNHNLKMMHHLISEKVVVKYGIKFNHTRLENTNNSILTSTVVSYLTTQKYTKSHSQNCEIRYVQDNRYAYKHMTYLVYQRPAIVGPKTVPDNMTFAQFRNFEFSCPVLPSAYSKSRIKFYWVLKYFRQPVNEIRGLSRDFCPNMKLKDGSEVKFTNNCHYAINETIPTPFRTSTYISDSPNVKFRDLVGFEILGPRDLKSVAVSCGYYIEEKNEVQVFWFKIPSNNTIEFTITPMPSFVVIWIVLVILLLFAIAITCIAFHMKREQKVSDQLSKRK